MRSTESVAGVRAGIGGHGLGSSRRQSEERTGWRGARRTSRWLACLVALLCLGAVGCSRKVTLPPDNVGSGGESAKDQCGELFANALAMVQPDRLGVTTDRQQVRDMFNQWRTDCLKTTETPALGPLAARHIKERWKGADLSGAVAMQFTGRDVELLRSRLLMKRAGDSVVKSADRDIDRVNLLFQYVVRNVALTPPSAEPLPVTPYDILLFGRGTAEDRAWVFAELLKQLRIDAVVLRPKSSDAAKSPANPSKDAAPRETSASDAPKGDAPKGDAPKADAPKDDVTKADAPKAESSSLGDAPRDAGDTASTGPASYLVGVLLEEPEKPIYLFDMVLGMAVPAPGDASFAPRPATLDQAVADPGVLKNLDVDEAAPYPITAEMLKSITVEVIGGGDGSLPRLALLQAQLTADDSVVLYDPLDDDGDSPGLLARVRSFAKGRWTEADLSLARFVDDGLAAAERPTDGQKRRLLVRRRPFDAPISIAKDKEKNAIAFGSPKKNQLKTRVSQLAGERKIAVSSYQIVRADGQIPPILKPPPEVVRMHARAEEDAFFWTGICQHELGDYDAAASTFADYLRRYPQGEWADHGRGLQARAYIAREKWASAMQALSQINDLDPARHGHRLLLKAVRARREAAEK